MAIKYKINILQALKDRGYSQYRLKKENILGSNTILRIKNNIIVDWTTIDVLCELLDCQPGDLLKHVPELEQGYINPKI